MSVRSDRKQIVFAQNAGNQFATANVSEKMLTSVTCVMTKQRKLECLRLQKKARSRFANSKALRQPLRFGEKDSSGNILLYCVLCSKECLCQTAGLWMCTGAAQRGRTARRLAFRRSYIFGVHGRILIQLIIWRIISCSSRTFYREYRRIKNS